MEPHTRYLSIPAWFARRSLVAPYTNDRYLTFNGACCVGGGVNGQNLFGAASIFGVFSCKSEVWEFDFGPIDRLSQAA